jgi:FkbM family methyltransferase
MSYSQNDEEAVVLRLLGERPARRFLDIGAHDGVTFSNTRRLAEIGWGGTLVEPSPIAFAKLMSVYEKRTDIALVHAAVVADGPMGLMRFYDSHGDMVSTADEAHRALWSGARGHRVAGQHVPAQVAFQPIFVAGISVAGLIEEFPGPYAFLNLDVEGHNFGLFKRLPLRQLGVSVACVEYQDKATEIEAIAQMQGYSVVHRNTENLILRAA